MNRKVEIVEVGARDGLQNEPSPVSTANKLKLISRLVEAGAKRLEVVSFVHPALVPQMADAEAVVAALPPSQGITYVGLVVNQKGFERALKTRRIKSSLGEIGCVVAASDSFGEKNQGQTRAESVAVAKKIIQQSQREGLPAQVTISASFGCPFEGPTPSDVVVDLVRELSEVEPKEIALADTIGAAVPLQVEALFSRAQAASPNMPLRAHFHNTRNTGVANAWAAFEVGVRTIDASVAGLGGCPFAPNASGNTATEDLAYLFAASGVETGLSLPRLIAITQWLEGELGRKLPAMVSHAGNVSMDPSSAWSK